MNIESRRRLFRNRAAEDGAKVTDIELFFDLVFVFAVTQLSHRLLDHLTPMGALETLILFAAVWWLWIYTSWATNWLDPEQVPVRALLIAMMLGGLVMSAVLPRAFEGGGLVFALAYVIMQVGRTLVIVWASWGHDVARARNFVRLTCYFLVAAPFWIVGALAAQDVRLALWAGALAIEYAGPWLFFRVPFLGASTPEDWDISGAHMAERCALFIIIALGEAIIVTGTTFAGLKPGVPTIVALVCGFASSAAMWWIYFDTGARRGNEAIEATEQTGRLARNAYTYLHMPIVAGIVVGAVADEIALAHPLDPQGPGFVLAACGGPALFLAGNLAFKWMTANRPAPPLSHGVGLALLIGIGVGAWTQGWSALTVLSLATGALIATAAWEWFSLNGGWRRWAPWIGRRTAVALEDSER